MRDQSLPVILFGKLPIVTTLQIQALGPEIEVTHLITSLPQAHTSLPSLLTTQQQQRKPAVVIVGGGFSDKEFAELRAIEGGDGVLWLRADNARVPESEWPPNPVYPGRAVERVKAVLREGSVLGKEWEVEERGAKEVKGAGEVWFY